MNRVSIQIVTWNSLKFLPDCLESIFNQSFRDFSVLVIDNNSHDHTPDYIEKNWPQVKMLKNSRNLGFARAHNQGIMATSGEFILVLNPDVILEPDFLIQMVNLAEDKKRIGSFAPKLLKIKFHHIDHGQCDLAQPGAGAVTNPEWCIEKTNILDSTGLMIKKTGRFFDRGEGEEDEGQYDRSNDVFGASGACAFYRRQALEDIKIFRPNSELSSRKKGAYEYFDEDFFAYQEDLDLAWRLQWRNWKALYLPQTKAYHVRRVSVINRFNKSSLVNFLSYRNHLWLLVKNLSWRNLFSIFFYVFIYQALKIGYLLLTQPINLLKAEISFWSKFGLILKKRQQIFSRAKVGADKIKKYIQ